ncbi:MAG TPA: aminopeptidase [Pseudobdellovibrionaceae bacterium]|nr:aminopeptidase [Pseudobdellovibrionaceae bacterium]
MNTSCQVTYLAKSAYSHLKIISSQVPLDEALSNPELSENEKEKIKLTLKVRSFIDQDLGLNVGKNYSTFVLLDKPYPVYVLQAAEPWELKSYQWWFPIVGHVPYKGYPTLEIAQKEADLIKDKYDVYVRPVPAYSTLGWLKDPLLSSMLKYKDHDLVNMLIHESVHATIFIKDDADFNERLATFLGNKGTELFYLKHEGPNSKTLELIQKENYDDRKFSDFISQELELLTEWYKEQKNKNVQDPNLKAQRLMQIQENFEKSLRSQMKSLNYGSFKSKSLNNAILLSYKTYMYDFSTLEKQYQESNQDFKIFLKRWQ